MHADLDTLVIALYVSIDELIGSRNGPRRGPGRPPKLSDAELLCLAVARSCPASPPSADGCGLLTPGSGTCFPAC